VSSSQLLTGSAHVHGAFPGPESEGTVELSHADVIFGAGASYDSAPDQGISRSPLAAGLTGYPSVAATYPASRAVIDYLDRAAGNGSTGLEAGLAASAELAERSTDRMMQLTAFRFYLCELIQMQRGLG
jgi:hypothetical protein